MNLGGIRGEQLQVLEPQVLPAAGQIVAMNMGKSAKTSQTVGKAATSRAGKQGHHGVANGLAMRASEAIRNEGYIAQESV